MLINLLMMLCLSCFLFLLFFIFARERFVTNFRTLTPVSRRDAVLNVRPLSGHCGISFIFENIPLNTIFALFYLTHGLYGPLSLPVTEMFQIKVEWFREIIF